MDVLKFTKELFDREKYKIMRKQIINCVLSTDMAKHSQSIEFLKKCLTENNKPEDNDKQDYMDLIVHTSDISNPTKIFDIYFKWAKLVVEEFYDQGDKEKNFGLFLDAIVMFYVWRLVLIK